MKSPRISIIVATDEENGIGKDNKIPWHIKKDLVRLSLMTRSKVAVVGDKSYNSMASYYDISGRPMPAKEYIVVSFDKNFKSKRNNTFVANSIQGALDRIKKSKEDEVFVIGGASIYKQMIEFTDRLYLTIVKGKFNCDTFFPDYSDFKKVISSEVDSDENYVFTTKIFEKI
ncbi:MAG TPA: dihydrofolate reductase [Patescibacteria group bacterium]|nr:dihydrofolate reductase [Patescibacteria group bacterium]